MILPSTYFAALALLIAGMLCQGSWANTFVAAKRRFELYYLDFALGALLASLLIAFTVGTLGFDGFAFLDDLLNAAKRQESFALAAGAVFNLGNMLLIAAIAESGMAAAFPIAMGIASAAGAAWYAAFTPGGNIALLFAGCVVVLFASAAANVGYRLYRLGRVDELVRTGKQKSTRRQVSSKSAVLAALGGVLIGCNLPLALRAAEGDVGVGPYSFCALFALGLFLSTLFYSLFFMNLPIAGEPLEIFECFKGGWKIHIPGWTGGAIWAVGLCTLAVGAAADKSFKPGPAVIRALNLAAPLVAALWGLFYWKEFAQADIRVRAMLFLALALFLCGTVLLSVAPAVVSG